MNYWPTAVDEQRARRRAPVLLHRGTQVGRQRVEVRPVLPRLDPHRVARQLSLGQPVLVLPAGAFDCPRSTVEGRLGSLSERSGARLLLTEDHEGGWTRTFAAAGSGNVVGWE